MALGLCRFTNAVGGTTDFEYPGPATDMQSPASAGAVNGTTYKYYAHAFDGSEWEIGTGAYNAGTGTFARTAVQANSLGDTTKIDFGNPPHIIVFDLIDLSAYATISAIADAGQVGQCKFAYVSATQVKLSPFNGCKLKINGALYSIPASGVTASNSGAAANTVYYCYAYILSGAVALELSTTAHATDTTAGNIGVEIKSGDPTRTLVGMLCTNGSSQFVDTASQRFVRSWFNRGSIGAEGVLDNSSSDAGISIYTEKTVSKAEFVCFADDLIQTFVSGVLTNSTTAGAVGIIIKIDGTNNGLQCDTNPNTANWRCPVAPTVHVNLTDGYHYVTFGMRALGGGTASAVYGLKAQARIG